jgi:predicted transcriptional regulator
MEENNELLDFVKALADANRLRIIGLLAQHPYSGEELAAMLKLKASTVSHHLSRLARVGLVSARAEGYYNIYRLEEAALHKVNRLFSKPHLASAAEQVDKDGYERKVIADFSNPDGSLKEIPAQLKKREVILRHVVRVFEPSERYTEKQVNTLLSRYHADTASLRRELVESGMMERESGGKSYWKPEKE